MAAALVSVIIPNRNYAAYVGVAIESALAQTYTPLEVIVVDNGSTDNSLEVLQRYGDRCRVFTQEDRGQSGARNRGVAESRGTFVAFLDADDAWRPDKLELQMALMTGRVVLVYCSLEKADAKLQPTGEIVPASFRGDVLEAFALWPGRAIVVGGESTVIIRRDALTTCGLFDEDLSISAGWDLWRRIATRYEIDYCADPLVLYRQHDRSLHRQMAAYETDVRAAAKKMFDDPAAARIWPWRERFYSGLDVMFAKSWLREHNFLRATVLAVRAARRRLGVIVTRAA